MEGEINGNVGFFFLSFVVVEVDLLLEENRFENEFFFLWIYFLNLEIIVM